MLQDEEIPSCCRVSSATLVKLITVLRIVTNLNKSLKHSGLGPGHRAKRVQVELYLGSSSSYHVLLSDAY